MCRPRARRRSPTSWRTRPRGGRGASRPRAWPARRSPRSPRRSRAASSRSPSAGLLRLGVGVRVRVRVRARVRVQVGSPSECTPKKEPDSHSGAGRMLPTQLTAPAAGASTGARAGLGLIPRIQGSGPGAAARLASAAYRRCAQLDPTPRSRRRARPPPATRPAGSTAARPPMQAVHPFVRPRPRCSLHLLVSGRRGCL